MALCSFCGETVYRYRVIPVEGKDSKISCFSCNGIPVRNKKLSTFPFTTTHLVAGQEITVNSLAHLRRLEKEHGVSSHAYNASNPERDWNPDPTEGRGMARIMEMRRQLESQR